MGRSATTWDRLAPLYDWQLPLERNAIRTAADLARPSPGDRLLDLATGSGAMLRELAARPEAPAEAVGVDASARMLARVPPLPPGWDVAQADATELPFADDSFDLATVAYLLHLLDRPRRTAVLAELARVLRPRGRLVTVTVAPPRRPRAAAAVERAFDAGLARLGPLAGLRPLDPRPDLAAAGFEPTVARRTGRGYPSLTVSATATRGGGG